MTVLNDNTFCIASFCSRLSCEGTDTCHFLFTLWQRIQKQGLVWEMTRKWMRKRIAFTITKQLRINFRCVLSSPFPWYVLLFMWRSSYFPLRNLWWYQLAYHIHTGLSLCDFPYVMRITTLQIKLNREFMNGFSLPTDFLTEASCWRSKSSTTAPWGLRYSAIIRRVTSF